MSDLKSFYLAKMDAYGLPTHCRDGLAGYLAGEYKHIGSFLMAVLKNDFAMAVMKADEINSICLRAYAKFLWLEAPERAWGSPEKVKAWIEAMGGHDD